jgi:hypothetical protein
MKSFVITNSVIFRTDYGLDDRSFNPDRDRYFHFYNLETYSRPTQFHIEWMTSRQSEMGRLCSMHEEDDMWIRNPVGTLATKSRG